MFGEEYENDSEDGLFDGDPTSEVITTEVITTEGSTIPDIPAEDFFDEEVVTTASLLDDVLAAKGISDGKIILLNENEEEIEVAFADLSREEQLAILAEEDVVQTSTSTEEGLEEYIAWAKELKAKNLTVQQYLDQYKADIISDQDSSSFEVDSFSDQELYALDLREKYELTDDEIVSELEREQSNPDLFKKKTDKIRAEYKELETARREQSTITEQTSRQEEYQGFVDTMVDIATKTPEFYGVELEDDDHNAVLSYLLELDEGGTSQFYTELKDPSKLYEAAWFLKYGKEAFGALTEAYESEISRIKKDVKPKVVVRKDPNKQNIKSIHDLT